MNPMRIHPLPNDTAAGDLTAPATLALRTRETRGRRPAGLVAALAAAFAPLSLVDRGVMIRRRGLRTMLSAALLPWAIALAQEPPAGPETATNVPPAAATNAAPEPPSGPPEAAPEAAPEAPEHPPAEAGEEPAANAASDAAPFAAARRAVIPARPAPATTSNLPLATTNVPGEFPANTPASAATNASAGAAGETPAGPAETAATANPNPLSFAAFKLIVDRNIFDPNRQPHRPGYHPARKNPVVDSFALVGTMTYAKGRFAFFDGTSSEYRKQAQAADTIADYKIAAIATDHVELVCKTNKVNLAIGMQLRREDEGDWTMSEQSGAFGGAGTGTNAASGSADSGAAPGGLSAGASDILKKLMERRAKAMNP